MPTRTVGIIGCGWLGKPLAITLQNDFKVQCYSREHTKDTSSFWKSQTIIIAINTKDNYFQTIKKILQLTPLSSNIILMSSISIYREFDKSVDEEIIITKINLQREVEQLIQSTKQNSIVLRLGGLMGDDRISGKWKKISLFSDGNVNYIHKEDVIQITKALIKNDIVSGIFNLVAPLHPLRSEIHKINSKKFGFTLGTFQGKTNRIILSDAIVKRLNYTFLYPDPLKFWD